MTGTNRNATVVPWVADPTLACLGRTRARVAEVITTDPVPGRVFPPIAGPAARVQRIAGRLVRYEKRGSVGIITARVRNLGEVFDEIDSLLDRIEQDGSVRVVAIYTLNGLFATMPIH
jgi:hypothetical protein